MQGRLLSAPWRWPSEAGSGEGYPDFEEFLHSSLCPRHPAQRPTTSIVIQTELNKDANGPLVSNPHFRFKIEFKIPTNIRTKLTIFCSLPKFYLQKLKIQERLHRLQILPSLAWPETASSFDAPSLTPFPAPDFYGFHHFPSILNFKEENQGKNWKVTKAWEKFVFIS